MDSPYTFLEKSAQIHKCILMLQAILIQNNPYPSQRWSRVEIEMAVLILFLVQSYNDQWSVTTNNQGLLLFSVWILSLL